MWSPNSSDATLAGAQSGSFAAVALARAELAWPILWIASRTGFIGAPAVSIDRRHVRRMEAATLALRCRLACEVHHTSNIRVSRRRLGNSCGCAYAPCLARACARSGSPPPAPHGNHLYLGLDL